MAKSKTKRKIGNFHNSLDGIICRKKDSFKNFSCEIEKSTAASNNHTQST